MNARAFRRPAVVAALALAAACRRAPPPVVTRIPETGPLLLVARSHLVPGDTQDAAFATYLIDPTTGATTRLKLPTLRAALDDIVMWSPAKQRIFVDGSNASRDVPLFSLALDGTWTELWREPYVSSDTPSVSSDGSSVFRLIHDAPELRATDGGSARVLPWTGSLLGINAVALSPHADRVAIARQTGSHGTLEVCDIDRKTCDTLFTAERMLVTPKWSSDGAHIAFESMLAGTPRVLWIADATGPDHHVTEVHLKLHDGENGPFDFAWSPDSRRIALISAHEGGCTDNVRDEGGTCYTSLYVLDADGRNVRRVRDGLNDASGLWWIR